MNQRVKRTYYYTKSNPKACIYQAKGAGALCHAKQEPKKKKKEKKRKKAPVISFSISTVLGLV